MAWQQVYVLNAVYSDNPVVVPHNFTTTQVIIKATSSRAYSYKQQLGWFYGTPDVPSVGAIKTKWLAVHMGNQLIDVPSIPGLQYQGAFVFLHWISNLTLVFFEDSKSIKKV